MTIRFLAAALLLVVTSATLHAAEPAPLSPAVGLSESAAKERAALFAAPVAITHMEMGRRMVIVVHRDYHAEEPADLGHILFQS